MDLSILYHPERFRRHVIETLAQVPLDYLENFELIRKHKNSGEPCGGAGVLLPLYFSEAKREPRGLGSQYVLFLNKRSKRVPQAGDLCVPGGGIHSVLDRMSQQILKMGFLPMARGLAFQRAKQRGMPAYEKILFILGNALRESWEEIRLSPFNVEFLGPLPSYSLQSRRWIMFPLVGRVKHAWEAKLSPEVDKLITIPLHDFFLPEKYAYYSLGVPAELISQGIPDPWEFPCLVYDADGEEEILWGATYTVIRSFLSLVFHQPLPSPDGRRIIRRPLPSNYFSGGEEI
jgi:8-oxo-dGTP pyrophosphatase MutT (NUDIX family)